MEPKSRGEITAEAAAQFAQEWISAWNAHDLERLLSHYAEELSYRSPFIPMILGPELQGIENREVLRVYFGRALELYPNLRFELLKVLVGMDGIIVHYRSVRNLICSEVMEFDESGKICGLAAYYTET